jgi:predicted DNA-binding protein with PD1-like motif
MKSRRISVGNEQRFVLVFDTGDEVIGGLQKFAAEQSLDASSFTAIGAFERTRLGFFDLEKKEYAPIPIDEQVEVVSMVGDITLDKGKPKIHAHVVVAKRDGTAHGGHLLEARVRPTLELVLVESPASLKRKTDPETGLGLISLEDSK